MTGLALRSLRHRPTSFVATLLAVGLGTVLMGSFATLVETSFGPVSDVDAETLVVMGAVVGGWGTLIVLFAVASTAGITVGQRAAELGTLRTVGATGGQVTRMVMSEVLAVGAVAALLGAGVATLTGRLLLGALRGVGLVGGDVVAGPGIAALGVTVAVVLLTTALAALVTARRATRGAPTVTPAEDGPQGSVLRWWRLLLGVVLVGYGVAMGVVTITVTADSADPYAAMSTSGSSSILVGVGMPTFAPWLLRGLARVGRPLLRGPAGHLAGLATQRRATSLGGVLGPVVVLTAATVGTLVLVDIDRRTVVGALDGDTELITLLNNVVVGMLSLFAAILVVNAYAAVLAHRRDELRRLWLLGATPEQVRRTVLLEAAVVAVVGVALGLLAALTTIVPFSIARDEGVVPDSGLWLPPVLAVAVLAVTLAAAASAFRRAVPPRVLAGAAA
ncbi:ABC transporter permease [Aeromicrobium sp. Leaf350]|uniref:ABC transporter permease n=1 Tax=Aeromicrobium sp. Leaf350 TaxID=2876565 RepID=UPI001E522D06|nr:ABC transporter permease [Aeromicrobium sp. Leaf350]